MRWALVSLATLSAPPVLRAIQTTHRGKWLAACGDDPLEDPPPPDVKRVAVLMWGESFRKTKHKGDRCRCVTSDKPSFAAQENVFYNHMSLFETFGSFIIVTLT